MTINAERKEALITDIVLDVLIELRVKSRKLPEHWDGIELRWLIQDRFAGITFSELSKRKGQRYRDYKNTCLVENLI